MRSKKKILHIIQSLDNGGCENMLQRTLPTLSDFEHTVVCLRSEGSLAPQFRASAIPILCPHYRSFLDLPGLLRLIKILRAEKPTLIITYLFHADVVGRIFLPLGIPKTPIIPFLRTTYNDARYSLARVFEKYTRFLVKQYFANSEAVKAFYVHHLKISPQRILVIPNGIDTTLYEKTTTDTSSLQKELSLPEESFVITCVANLHPNKGHQHLLDAFIQIAKDYPSIHLLLVGDGIERGSLQQTANHSPYSSRILFLGQRSDVREILALSHLFVLPTFFEGLSNALQEAMAMHLPCITTDIPENRILITPNVNGILVPSRSSEALEVSMREILTRSDFSNTLAARARKTITESYSLEATTKLFTKEIEQVLCK